FMQASAVDPSPAFLVVTGDITDTSSEAEFAAFDQAVAAGLDIPLVPVEGNHDVYDGGVLYRAHLGPPAYAFDCGGAHFIVLSYTGTTEAQLAFIARDLTFSTVHRPTVVFAHLPPDVKVADQIAALGVDLMFTGHMHQNQVLPDGGMLQLNT